ncbi:MAG TPA: prepilin-type N-terminal cleavage/methylation domain-containing protein [Candidatus Saccharimonadales bacterium]|jgi:prepilin-type N-terminal cleavage/methylation domain-containing protein
MKRGGHGPNAAGFTIIEVLIVLAISSALLISAAALISGRQANTEFTTGINNVQQQLQQIINETASGYYPNAGDFTCRGSTDGGSITFQKASPSQQGTNYGCIFLGKAIQFGLGSSGDDPSTLGVLPLVGNQNYDDPALANNGAQPVQTLAKAAPRAVYPATANEAAAGTPPATAIATTLMNYGLSVADKNGACSDSSQGGICYKKLTGDTTFPTGIAAFVAGNSSGNIATAGSNGVGLASGSEQFSLYGVDSSQPNEAFQSASAAIDYSNLVSASALYVCITSATTANQSGLFTIEGGSLNVKLQIKGDAEC